MKCLILLSLTMMSAKIRCVQNPDARNLNSRNIYSYNDLFTPKTIVQAGVSGAVQFYTKCSVIKGLYVVLSRNLRALRCTSFKERLSIEQCAIYV